MERVDLKRPSERALNILEPLNFETLLLEVECNLKTITPHTVRLQFELDMRSAIESARDVFNHNLPGIMRDAVNHRNMK